MMSHKCLMFFPIAEYIMALSALSWDTFCCAVTEKYFRMVWSYDLLLALFNIIGGGKSTLIQ